MKKVDIKTLAEYSNQYIAISKDSSIIFASGKTIRQLEEKLERKNIEDAVIEFIPPINKAISPACQ